MQVASRRMQMKQNLPAVDTISVGFHDEFSLCWYVSLHYTIIHERVVRERSQQWEIIGITKIAVTWEYYYVTWWLIRIIPLVARRPRFLCGALLSRTTVVYGRIYFRNPNLNEKGDTTADEWPQYGPLHRRVVRFGDGAVIQSSYPGGKQSAFWNLVLPTLDVSCPLYMQWDCAFCMAPVV